MDRDSIRIYLHFKRWFFKRVWRMPCQAACFHGMIQISLHNIYIYSLYTFRSEFFPSVAAFSGYGDLKLVNYCRRKIILATVFQGSTRSNPLGEVTINMAHFTSSRASAAVSQPLKKCSYGTTLQVRVTWIFSNWETYHD